MAVLESESNALNTCSSTRPYGCKDRKIRPGYFMPVRRYDRDGSGDFQMVTKFIPHRMSAGCRYDKAMADPRCCDCKHRKVAGDYDHYVRNEGK